jgi:hypothetical protein
MATKQKMTLERLARITERGFASVEGRLDSAEERLGRFQADVDSRLEGVDRKLDSMENELREIGIVLGPLVRTVAAMEIDLRELRGRVNRLERKAGLSK